MKTFLFLILFISQLALAKEEHKFRPDYWSKGLHLMVGGGINTSHFYSDDNYDEIGYGINFKTDLGYYFTNRFAIEWSSNVKFNKVERSLIWDTLMTFGLRYRIKEYYVRGFLGRAPTVVFFNGDVPPEYENTKASRVQFTGPVYGLGVGKMFKNRRGLIWFVEGAGSFQNLQEREGIYMKGEVPVVVKKDSDNSVITSLYLMAGVLFF